MRPKRGLDVDLHQNPMPAGACTLHWPAYGAPLQRVNLAVRIEFNPNITTAWFTSVMSIINNVTMLAIILWCRANSRTRAPHHGPPPGHATDRIRNRNGEGVGEWLGDYHRCRAFALRRSPHVSRRSHRRFDPVIHDRGDDLSVLRDRYRNIPGDRGAVDAPTGPAVHAGLLAHEYAVRQQYPARKYAPWLAKAMQASPSTHFVSFAQAILYRGAGIDVVWLEFVIVALIGGLFFALAILRFRSVAA
jgi:ABC-2 type transport system permease protein